MRISAQTRSRLAPRLGLLLALSAAGCTTPQERAAQMQAEVANMMAIYGPACARMGYARDSDPWRNCVLHLSMKDDLQRYARSPGYYPGWGPYGRGDYWGPYW